MEPISYLPGGPASIIKIPLGELPFPSSQAAADGASPDQMTSKFCVCGLLALLCLLSGQSLDAQETSWPSFLPARAEVRNAELVEEVWKGRTFERHLNAPPLHVPIVAYVALIDSPDILAAAARYRGITDESAEEVNGSRFELRSPDGSRASYRVIWSQPNRRVILSQGSRVVFGLTVSAAVVGVLTISNLRGPIQQDLRVFVRMDNPVLSFLTRAVRLILPSIADKELLRGFQLAHEVAEWAWWDRQGFCTWLHDSAVSGKRAQDVGQSFDCPLMKR